MKQVLLQSKLLNLMLLLEGGLFNIVRCRTKKQTSFFPFSSHVSCPRKVELQLDSNKLMKMNIRDVCLFAKGNNMSE